MQPDLMDEVQQVFEKNVATYREAAAKIRAIREHVDQSRLLTRMHGPRRIARLRRLLIIARIVEGRLPETSSPIVWGMPGQGGQCDACDGYMPPTRTVMSIPHGDGWFAFVHAECYVIWLAQVRLRAAVRRISG